MSHETGGVEASGFDKITTSGAAGVVIPEVVFQAPQGRIVDIELGTWALGAVGSVYFTRDLPSLVVDGYERAWTTEISDDLLHTNPLLLRAYQIEGDVPIEGFVADLRRLRPYSKLLANYNLGSGSDSPEFSEARREYGTQLLQGAVLADGGETHYVGRPVFAEVALEFTTAVDMLAHLIYKANRPLNIPAEMPQSTPHFVPRNTQQAPPQQ